MLMLSITPMDISHVDEICEDLRLQQEQGISDCAMLTAHLEAEGTPPVSKGAIYGKLYRQFRKSWSLWVYAAGFWCNPPLAIFILPMSRTPFKKSSALLAGTVSSCCRKK